MLAIEITRFNTVKIGQCQMSDAASCQHHGNVGAKAAKTGDTDMGIFKTIKNLLTMAFNEHGIIFLFCHDQPPPTK